MTTSSPKQKLINEKFEVKSNSHKYTQEVAFPVLHKPFSWLSNGMNLWGAKRKFVFLW